MRLAYKKTKADFRRLLRICERVQRDSFFRDLDLAANDSSKLFNAIRRTNGQCPEATKILLHNGTRYEGSSTTDGWVDYFGSLASPSEYPPSSSAASIEKEYDAIRNSTSSSDCIIFSCEEVSDVISTLKQNKAAGKDNIDPEHLAFGGNSLVVHLTRLFNAMMSTSHIPSAFRIGMIVPIPKGRNKDYSCPSNYRGITILSNVSKILEKLILQKLLSQDDPPSLNSLQGGFREGYSCLHTAFIYQEAVQFVREKNRKVYVAFLDVRKAFDTVWHKGLLVKAHRKGVRGHIWRLLDSWYSSSMSSVLWNNQVSKRFSIKQGVRQGGILSPLLYCIYVDELLDIFASSGLGISIGDVYCGSPMYADDLALLADSPDVLQSMLNIANEYATRWRYSFNASKSVVLVLAESVKSRDLNRLNRVWKLGDSVVQEVDEQHHLGILRSVLNSTVQNTNERCSACRSAFYALNAVGSRFGSLHPTTSFKLYQSLCLPVLLYGAEISMLSGSEVTMMERVHRKILRSRSPSSL